jgi:hypothetical protein
VRDHRGVREYLNASQSTRGQAVGPCTGWPLPPPTPCREIVPGDDTCLGGTGAAPPRACPSHWPYPASVGATGRRTVKLVQPEYWWAPPRAVPETPRASPSHATSGGQTVRPHRRGHDTGPSTCRAGPTPPAMPHRLAEPSPYDTAAAVPLRPTCHRPPDRAEPEPPSPGRSG